MESEHEADVPAERVVERAVLKDLDMAETIAELHKQIEGLNFRILDCRIEELPMRLHRHTIGVPNRWMRLLRRIARSIACYHEHH